MDKLIDCPVQATLAAIGGKWKPRILWRLREGPARFKELHRVVGVSEKVLNQNLRALEQDGLISRTPTRIGDMLYVEYRYTDYGLSLVPVLDTMGQWGLNHRSLEGEPTIRRSSSTPR